MHFDLVVQPFDFGQGFPCERGFSLTDVEDIENAMRNAMLCMECMEITVNEMPDRLKGYRTPADFLGMFPQQIFFMYDRRAGDHVQFTVLGQMAVRFIQDFK